MHRIARRYARALFALMQENESLLGELQTLHNALKANVDLMDVLASPVIPRDQMIQCCGQIADVLSLSSLARNLLGVLVQKKRLSLLPSILHDVFEIVREARGERRAWVATPEALTGPARTALTKTLSTTFDSTVYLEETVDADLVGGVVVRIGPYLMDTSIKNQLAQLTQALKG